MRTLPAAGSASPARMRVRVVFPAPLRPTRPTLSPAATRNVTSAISSRAPARTSSCWAVIIRVVSLGADAGLPAIGEQGLAMRFNPKARLDTRRVRDSGRGGGGRSAGGAASRLPIPGGAAAGGGIGGVVLIILVIVVMQFLGDGGDGSSPSVDDALDTSRAGGDTERYAQCETGADA